MENTLINQGTEESSASDEMAIRSKTTGDVSQAGAVIFDAAGLADSGWACVSGEPPFRIKSPFALATDTIWWSNLPFDRMNGRAPRSVRPTNYLRITMDQARAELGLRSTSAEETVERLAFHFKVMTRLVETISDRPFPDLASTNSFHQDLISVAGASPIVPQDMAKNFIGKDGWHWTRIEEAKNSETVILRVPRLSYALDLLARPVPSTAVTWRQKPEIDPMETIRNTLAPVYAEYAIKSAQPKVAQIFGLARHGTQVSSADRVLAAHPELLALDSFAQLKVKGHWKGEDYIPANQTLPPKLFAFLNSKQAPLSWSMGILAHSLVHGICAPFSYGGRSGNLTWRGVWLHGADKVTMFAHALAFTKAGYRPASYGHGWIRVVRPETATANAGLLSVAVRRGLLPDPGEFDPAIIGEVASGVYGPPAPEGGWGIGAFPAHICLTNRYEISQMTDDMPLLAPGALDRRWAMLKPLLKARVGN